MKTRQDSLAEFEKAGREDLISHVKKKWQYYKNTYRTVEDEIRTIVQEAITACGDSVNMGNVMKHVMPKTKGAQMVKLSIILLKNCLDNDIVKSTHSIYSY